MIDGSLLMRQHSTVELPAPHPRDARVLGTRLFIHAPIVLVDVEFLDGLVKRPKGD